MTPFSSLNNLFETPEHRILFETAHYWVTVRSFRPASRMLLEVSCNKNLTKAHQLSQLHTTRTVNELGRKERRQGYSSVDCTPLTMHLN